jgi:hypothetical protein
MEIPATRGDAPPWRSQVSILLSAPGRTVSPIKTSDKRVKEASEWVTKKVVDEVRVESVKFCCTSADPDIVRAMLAAVAPTACRTR